MGIRCILTMERDHSTQTQQIATAVPIRKITRRADVCEHGTIAVQEHNVGALPRIGNSP